MAPCLICLQESQVFLVPPCNHKNMCWKCCLKISEGSHFNCPFCQVSPKGKNVLVFVDEQQMNSLSFQQIFMRGVLRSAKKQHQFYSNEKVANYVEQRTSLVCQLCPTAFSNLNAFKKHLNQIHHRFFCDVCLDNRKCLIFEQYLYSEGQLNKHLKTGQFSEDGLIVLYHPICGFCKTRFYDSEAFQKHLLSSTHLHCHVCQKNYPEFRYVYYKDYEQIQKHFKKSHFMCDQGICINQRLQNVYVSAAALEEHKNRAHHKFKKKNQGSEVLNLLMFQKDQKEAEEQPIEWDGIGKEMSAQFNKGLKNYKLEIEEHTDKIIDIRQFYPEKVRPDNRMSLQTIAESLLQHIYRDNYKNKDISLATTPLFSPYSDEACSFSRFELQKFLRSIFPAKFSDPIIILFFSKRHEYRSAQKYFQEIRQKMFSFNPLTYYYVFPQLIRFMRNENKNKRAMDEFYCSSLRELKINKVFVFHALERYSDVFSLLQEQIETYLSQLLFKQELQIEKYKKYLSELNPNFYHEHQSELFYVQKDKMTNLYHMVEKCKTKDMLKMNWLLKVGFSQNALKTIHQQFYYRTLEQCGQAIKQITIQELALLYAYVVICLQALFDKNKFKYGKLHSYPLFLSHILYRIPKCIYDKEKRTLEQIERHCLEIISVKPVLRYNGLFVNEADHPPLPVDPMSEIRDEQFPNLNINAEVRLNPKSRAHLKRIKVRNRGKDEGAQQEEFPTLGPPKHNPEGAIKDEEEEAFPVFNYEYNKEVNPKKTKYIKDTTKRKSRDENKGQSVSTANKSDLALEVQPDYKQQHSQVGQYKKIQIQSQQEQIVNAKKKRKRQKDYVAPIKQKKLEEYGGKEEEYPSIGCENSQTTVTEPVEGEKSIEGFNGVAAGWKLKKIKKSKVKFDLSDSEDEEVTREDSKKNYLEEKKLKLKHQEQELKRIKSGEDFQPLSSKPAEDKLSIVNQIIQESRQVEEEPQVKIKKGKRGKHIVITSVNLSQL